MGYVWICIKGSLLWELAYIIMETKKSQDPKSANWWTRKSCSAIQFKSKGLRTRRVNSVNPNSSLNTLKPGEWYQRAGEDGYFSPSEIQQIHLSYLFLFRPSSNWVMPTCLWEGTLLYSVYQSNAIPIWEHPQTPPEIMFYQLSGHPLPQSSWSYN